MSLPQKPEAEVLLAAYVSDPYQLYHAKMVATAMAGYAEDYKEDEQLYWLTGYFHDIDYEKHSDKHPGPSLQWFKDWQYPDELIHAVEAHAFGFNGFNTKPTSRLAKTLRACDEICGIFYAYRKLNPISYGEMKATSIMKRLQENRFAPGIDRNHIVEAVKDLEITLEDHVNNLINFFKDLS